MVVLIYGVWFVFTARQLRLNIQPEPDQITIQGGLLTPQLKGYYLLRPGTYHVPPSGTAMSPSPPTSRSGIQARQTVDLVMEKLPGRLDIATHVEGQPASAITQVRILIDRQAVGETPLNDLEVAAGSHLLQIETDLYRPLETTITVEGEGRRQSLTFGLTPDYADVSVDSKPPGAEISVDGHRHGVTPATLPMGAGRRRLELRRAGYKPWEKIIQIAAGPPITLEAAVLLPLDGRLVIGSRPPGANVMIGTQYQGQTPLEVDLAAGSSPSGPAFQIRLRAGGP